jgi:hypothetical protein
VLGIPQQRKSMKPASAVGASKVLGLLLPQAYALDASRRLLIAGSTSQKVLLMQSLIPVDPIIGDVVVLLAISVVYVPLGYYAFRSGIRYAQRIGNLTRWV